MGEETLDIVIVIIANSKGEFYVHQRPPEKKVFPNMYGLGAGGKINPDDKSPEAAGIRETKEELGVTPKLTYLVSFPFEHTLEDGTRLAYNAEVLMTVHDGPFNVDEKEQLPGKFMGQTIVDMIYKNNSMMPDTKIAYDKLRERISAAQSIESFLTNLK